MKTRNMIQMAMGMVLLMLLSLSGCTQHSTAGGMDTSMEGTMNEQKMDTAMDTMEKGTMKNDMEEMNNKKMQDSMETMKGDTMKTDTMQEEMDETKDTMMKDSSREMMK